MKNWLSNHWLKIIAIIMLVGALAYTFPYVYYQFMNWVVVGASLVTVQQALTKDRIATAWVYIFLAVVFNPIAPFSLRADVWQIADLAAIVLFLIALTIRKELDGLQRE